PACSDKKNAEPSDAAAAGDSNPSTDAGAGGGALTFVPSNVAAPSFDGLGDVVITKECIFDTDSGEIDCPGTIEKFPGATFSKVEQTDGSNVGLFAMKSLSIGASAQVRVIGSIPAVLMAATTIDVEGNVTTLPAYSESAAGGFVQDPSGHGGGPGGGDAALNYTGGGGGAYCGRGGKGGIGNPSGQASNGGAPYGAPDLVPLLGGASGGGGPAASLDQSGGQGGGALQLTAGMRIRVTTTGRINVGGGAGHSNGGGAGSGGALLLEAPTVVVAGVLAANGGGGAVFNGGSSGQSGMATETRALGSVATAGQGSSATDVDGTDGTALPDNANSAGGGGGGAGRIRVNTTSGAAMITGKFSPAATTECATQGTLHG
ncbi:MAG: hypothetical protein ABIS92_13865, partial [Polyangia bacterium]